MKLKTHKEKTENSHVNVTQESTACTSSPAEPIAAPEGSDGGSVYPSIHQPKPPSPARQPNPALALVPHSALDRQFRASSFASKLNEVQRSTLSLWLVNDDLSVEDIRKKVAAPPPAGLGMEVQPTTLRRLRVMAKNSEVGGWFTASVDTACDLLVDPDTAEVAPLREALRLMLYSRAVYATKNQAAPSDIDKLVTTIAKVEKLAAHSQPATPRISANPITTRHHVELTVRTDPRERELKAVHATELPPSSHTTANQNCAVPAQSCKVPSCDLAK
jgi:hypothetical protein